ncbi:hypothetical protein [Algoriphagus pacificus]|nr:hypothetical protein [Algoriphagus pacificus]
MDQTGEEIIEFSFRFLIVDAKVNSNFQNATTLEKKLKELGK